jgi:hypothetical protein
MSVNNAGVIIITDMEKNRYKISNLEKLPQQANNPWDGSGCRDIIFQINNFIIF